MSRVSSHVSVVERNLTCQDHSRLTEKFVQTTMASHPEGASEKSVVRAIEERHGLTEDVSLRTTTREA